MPSDLCVALHGGGTLLQVHALDDGIFPELLFNGQHGLLAATLPLQLLFLGGGLLLGAFFMATDYTTSPLYFWGRVVFAFGCGLMTMVIREFGSLPEGVSYSIILMNILTPLIERYIKPRPFGAMKKAKKGGAKNEA